MPAKVQKRIFQGTLIKLNAWFGTEAPFPATPCRLRILCSPVQPDWNGAFSSVQHLESGLLLKLPGNGANAITDVVRKTGADGAA
jgi:hypothetical protein